MEASGNERQLLASLALNESARLDGEGKLHGRSCL
jgi:hypothetical protein